MAFNKYSAERPSTVKVSEDLKKVKQDGANKGSEQINSDKGQGSKGSPSEKDRTGRS